MYLLVFELVFVLVLVLLVLVVLADVASLCYSSFSVGKVLEVVLVWVKS
jgi:hypothetical protein